MRHHKQDCTWTELKEFLGASHVAEVVAFLVSKRSVVDQVKTLADHCKNIPGAEAREEGALMVSRQEDFSSDDRATV